MTGARATTPKGERAAESIVEAAIRCLGRDGYAATSVQRIADLALDDVAKGAHRGYRYVLPKRDARAKVRVKEVQLLRSDGALAGPPSGWSGMTGDVNEGRGRSHLYLMWKVCA